VFAKRAFIVRLVTMMSDRELAVQLDIIVLKPLYHHSRASQELSATQPDFQQLLIVPHAQVDLYVQALR